MIRRLHVANLRAGSFELSNSDARHARDVLRLTVGTLVEVFDDLGHRADATIERIDRDAVLVRVENVAAIPPPQRTITIACSIPKGERADWMIEKLSELGVWRFIPLIAQRSVVQASGKNKLDRWKRIAVESAKQSRRTGVMAVDDPIELGKAIPEFPNAFVLSTSPAAMPLAGISTPASIALFVGPEGGWSEEELAIFERSNAVECKLTETVLRVETAAIAAAAIVASKANESDS